MKYLLVSPSRCGSQLLTSALHDKNGTMLNEIFTHGVYKRRTHIQGFKLPIRYIDRFLNEAKTESSGAKILIGPMFKHNVIDEILSCPKYKIIFMYRENLLESYVSRKVAQKKRQWMAPPAKYSPLAENINLDEDLDLIEIRLQSRFDQATHCLDLINSNQNLKERSLIVKYTDIYEGGEVQLEPINKARNFVGLESVNKPMVSFVKQNHKDTYSFITNRKELEDRFGEKYGFLDSSETPLIWKDYYNK